MNKILIDLPSLVELREIFKKISPKSVIWAYGSRIDGSAHEGSDLDLAIADYGQPESDIIELKEAIRESNIPFLIDLFDLKKLPKSLQEEIERNYVVLFDGEREVELEILDGE